jgi:hypothetical protein
VHFKHVYRVLICPGHHSHAVAPQQSHALRALTNASVHCWRLPQPPPLARPSPNKGRLPLFSPISTSRHAHAHTECHAHSFDARHVRPTALPSPASAHARLQTSTVRRDSEPIQRRLPAVDRVTRTDASAAAAAAAAAATSLAARAAAAADTARPPAAGNGAGPSAGARARGRARAGPQATPGGAAKADDKTSSNAELTVAPAHRLARPAPAPAAAPRAGAALGAGARTHVRVRRRAAAACGHRCAPVIVALVLFIFVVVVVNRRRAACAAANWPRRTGSGGGGGGWRRSRGRTGAGGDAGSHLLPLTSPLTPPLPIAPAPL